MNPPFCVWLICQAEILRLDPKFDVDVFSAHLERVIIPAVLEAHLAGDAPVLQDWCTEAKYR